MKATSIVLALLLLVSVAVATYYGMQNREARSELRALRDVKASLRLACMDNFLRRETEESRVMLFRTACLKIGIWNGPPKSSY